MNDTGPRFAGVELYFKDLAAARRFYSEALGLAPDEERPEHHVKFSLGDGFLCLERTRVEDYPSEDKAVIFLEVGDLSSTFTGFLPRGSCAMSLAGIRPGQRFAILKGTPFCSRNSGKGGPNDKRDLTCAQVRHDGQANAC